MGMVRVSDKTMRRLEEARTRDDRSFDAVINRVLDGCAHASAQSQPSERAGQQTTRNG